LNIKTEAEKKEEKLVRFPALQERVPFCRAQFYLLMKKGKFPKPLNIGGRAIAWRSSDIDAWIASRSEI
jgi:prophage regulatory protein